jgi:X-X-X-Leu-X-X-Gly heptad repeat protein
MAYRYEDLPYFDPVIDKKIIARYMRLKDFISFTDFLVFILAVFLMQSFMNFVPQMVEGLKGGSPADTSSVFSAAKGLHFPIVRAFKDTVHETWNIGKSLNTRRIIDSGESLESRLRKGVGGLRDGVGGLRDGVGTLRAGVRGPRDGVGGLRDGVGGLRDGVGGLRDGVGGLRDGVGSRGERIEDRLRKAVSDSGESIEERLTKGVSGSGESIEERLKRGVLDSGDGIAERLRKGILDSGESAEESLRKGISDSGAYSGDDIKKQTKNLLDEIRFFDSGGAGLNLSSEQVSIVKKIVESDKFNTLPIEFRSVLLKLLGR